MKNEKIIKKMLVESKEQGIPKDLKQRDIGEKIDFKINKAHTIAGMRRTGKTYLMFQLMKKFENSYYINFEDERLSNPSIKDLSNLVPIIKETFKVKIPFYLFVDEIQNIKNWEKWARRIAEKKDIFLILSGSSSQLSSRQIATSLRGRTLTTYVFPLNFKEFLKFREVEYSIENIEYSQKKPDLRRHFQEYLKYGGLPEIVLEKTKRKKIKILQEYFSTIIARDLIERYSINKVHVLESFMKLLVNNFSRNISFSKSKNWLNSMGIKVSKSTLIKYFNYLKESFFLFDNTIFSHSIKDQEQYPRKIYVVDNGFITALTERFDTDKGWYFENKVATILYQKALSDPAKQVHYWKNGDKEVDFVIKKNIKIDKLIQVCSDLNKENKKREIDSLLTASKDLKCNNLLIITDDYQGIEKINGKKVEFQPLWRWLLD